MPDGPKSVLATIRSDSLRLALDLRDVSPLFRLFFGDLVQIVVIVDASAVQSELRWRLGSRINPEARTSLHEVFDSGLLVAFAPTFLKQEIEKHLPRIASETGATMEAASTEWERLRHAIRFYTPKGDGAEFAEIDPEDSPYAQAAKELHADFVRTSDRHFTQMGVAAIGPDLDLVLRNYARSTSILVTVKTGTGVAAFVGVEALAGIIRAITAVIQRLPPGVKLAIGIAIAIALLHPRSREKLMELSKTIWKRVKEAKPVAALISEATASHLAEAMETSRATGEAIRSRLPVRGKQTALAHVRQVLLRSRSPLTADEIAHRITVNGYTSRSKTLTTYVRRLLRSDPAFAMVGNGLWSIGSAH